MGEKESIFADLLEDLSRSPTATSTLFFSFRRSLVTCCSMRLTARDGIRLTRTGVGRGVGMKSFGGTWIVIVVSVGGSNSKAQLSMPWTRQRAWYVSSVKPSFPEITKAPGIPTAVRTPR